MIVTLKSDADPKQVKRKLARLGLWVEPLVSHGEGPVAFAVAPHSRRVDPQKVLEVEEVASVASDPSAHPRLDELAGSSVAVGEHRIGPGAPFAVFAGPCSIDSEERIYALARRLGRSGVRFLRGGAFKPRTSPYSFQGLGEQALEWMRRAGRETGMAVVTECMSERSVETVAEYADMIQVGSRNMQNFALLKEVGKAAKPVLLKRGMAATFEEWLLAGEYLLVHGASGVVFCERGVRGFEPSTRNLVDLAAAAQLAHVLGQPVIVDPSHGTGRVDLVPPLCRATRAVGAHGVMFETHDDPGHALSDGPQALAPDDAETLARELSD